MSAMVTRMRTAGFQTNREGGGQQKAAAARRSPRTALPTPQRSVPLREQPNPFKVPETPGAAAASRSVSRHLRLSARSALQHAAAAHKMADTPLSLLCAPSSTFLPRTTKSRSARNQNLLLPQAETFIHLPVWSEDPYGLSDSYLERWNGGQLRVLCFCFGSSAPLPPRLLRHLYRDPGRATAHARRLIRFLCRRVHFPAPYLGGQTFVNREN